MKTTNNRFLTETVLIENSDERLAAVEEAKRTGQPFQSVGANKAEIVPTVVAQQIMDEAAMEDVYVGPHGTTYAAHLQSYHEKVMADPNFVTQTNEEKAAAHAAYSAEFVRARNEEEERIVQLMKEGYEPSLAVQQANFERALEHEEKSRGYGRLRAERNADDENTVDHVMEVVVEAASAAASMTEAIEAARAASTVPDVSEKYAKEELVTKDKIVETVESFEDHAKDAEALKDKDHPAVEILESAGSPDQLRESTGLAQAAAQNPAFDKRQVEEVAEKTKSKARRGKKSLTEANAEAVEEVAAEPADEMHENPSE